MEEERQALLSGSSFPPDHEPRVPPWTGEYPSSEFENLVSGSEIRAAASADPYPAWIHACVVTREADSSLAVTAQPPSHGENRQQSGLHSSVQSLQEDEIRDLMIDHVSHHCCWGKKPAWSWKIQKVEDCNAYVGTLETFIEERDVLEECIPYDGRKVDGSSAAARAPGPWEVDTRAQFPHLFVPRKEALLKLPHSERLEECKDCSGKGEIACNVCTVYDKSGNLQQRKSFTCSKCNGRGLIAHLDGSDSNCKECNGTGRVYCPSCSSRGLIKCNSCHKAGAFIWSRNVLIKWTTLLSRKVIASCHAASVPDEVFQRAKGVQIYCNESQQCQPVQFQDSEILTRFSQEIISERPPIPRVARIICERHRITMVPVTRVVMVDPSSQKWFSFYIVGLKKEIFLKNYPYQCCWGMCSIL